ncbi:MAG: UDP-N-acetylmuramoyl-L-alanine--D-glutamate ligase [Bacillota bacterium]|nr:UDP-N-acetylmuramoyl-L-alanine--D-glutamate ligase [Bacillota bacterium]
MKKVLIIGSGKSGLAAEKLLKGKCETYIWDDNMPLDKRPCVEDFDEVLLSPGVPLTNPIAQEAKQLNKKITGELEVAFENTKASFVAITGTNGKTTTTALVGEIFKAAGFDTRVVGNIGLPVSEEVMSANDDTKLITEVSSFQLETISDFHAHISALLNITPDHLDRHKTFENYASIKARIANKQNENDFFVYNLEDPTCVRIAESLKGPKLVGFSSKINHIDNIFIPGDHNMQNALAALAIARCMGISDDISLKVIAEFKGVEHRIEFVRELDGVRYVNDSKGTNPDSTIKAIEATAPGILLIAGGYEKNLDFTELIQSFNGKVKKLLMLGEVGPRFANKAIELGFNKDDIIFCKDMAECVELGHKLAVKGDTVLLSPASASWGMYKNFEERGKDFKNLVNKL